MKLRTNRVLLLALLVTASAGAGSAHAASGRVQGAYKLHSPGRMTPEDFDGTPADASWTVGAPLSAKNGQGALPATLTAATHGPFVQPCATDDPSHGTTTTLMSGVVDPAASFSFFLRLDLLRNRGSVDAYPGPYDFGTSSLVTQMRCEPDYGGSADSQQEVPVTSAFPSLSSPNAWKVRKTGTSRWAASGTQHVLPAPGPGDAGPSTATLDLTMTGTPSALQAGCKLPTPHDLRKARTRTAALRILHRAGMRADTSITRRSVAYVAKGHFYVNDWAVDHYGTCGSSVPLILSLGAPSGAVGHGGA